MNIALQKVNKPRKPRKKERTPSGLTKKQAEVYNARMMGFRYWDFQPLVKSIAPPFILYKHASFINTIGRAKYDYMIVTLLILTYDKENG